MVEEQGVREEINRFCSQMSNKEVRTVILFGSRAKGNGTENSDVDLCVIADDLPQEVLKRRYPAPSGYKLLSILGFHPDEFITMLKDANPLILDIVSCGEIVYDNGFFKQVEGLFHQVIKKYGLKRQERGWSWRH